jgi:ferredoxin
MVMKRYFVLFAVVTFFFGIFTFNNSLISEETPCKDSKIESTGTATIGDLSSTAKTSTIKTVEAASVNMKNCIKCGLCASICPANAIKIINHRPVIDPEKCTRCGLCLSRCPTKAISYKEYENSPRFLELKEFQLNNINLIFALIDDANREFKK